MRKTTIWINILFIVNLLALQISLVIAEQEIDITTKLFLEEVLKKIKNRDNAGLILQRGSPTEISGHKFICYHFKTSKDMGYTIMNITNKNPAIEEFSFTEIPSLKLTNISTNIAQKAAGIDRILNEPKSIYLGPSFYILSYLFYQNDKALGEITVDVIDRKVVTLNMSRINLSTQETNNNIINTGQTVSFSYLSTIVIYPYYISNEVACMAMIFDYWEKNGLPTLRGDSPVDPGQKESDTEFMAAIAKSCEKCTHMAGIELFSSSRGYYTETKCYFKYPVGKNKLQASYEIVKEEILQKRPILLHIASSSLVHTVVGIGFLETPQGRFVITVMPGINTHRDIIDNAFFYNWDGSFDNLSITIIKPHLISSQKRATEQN